jgi:general secretion pathway protein D
MNRFFLQLLCLGLLLQSLVWTASAQTDAAPKIDTNADNATAPAPLIGPESDANASPASKAAQMETIKRQELSFASNEAITDGEKLFRAGQLDAAAERFKYALENLPQNGDAAPIRLKAAKGLAAVRVEQGDAAFKAKKYEASLKLYQEALDLVPDSGTCRSRVERAKDKVDDFQKSAKDVRGTENNPALTPEVREKMARIQQLYFEGERFYETGQYEEADKRYKQILALDPTNKAARSRLAKLDKMRTQIAEKQKKAVRDEAIEKVGSLWPEKVPASYGRKTTVASGTESSESKYARMVKKLQDMRIPNLSFNQADIQTVIQVLTSKSRELDKGDGINFVLKTEPSAPAAAATGDKPADGAPAAPAAQPTPIPPVTLNLTDAPMMDVLRFISQITNLQVKVEEYAVFLLPPNDASDVLQTRPYAVPANFFEGGLRPATAAAGSTAATVVSSVKIDVKQQLTDKGVQFPEGATAAFLAGSSRLVVKNTPDQLDIIQNLIDSSNVEVPQVEIETRLTEFTDDQLKALTFNYYYSSSTVLGSSAAGTPANVSTYGYSTLGEPTNQSLGTFGAIVPNSLDAVLANNVSTGDGSARNYLYPAGSDNQYLSTQNFNTIGFGGVLGSNAWGVICNLVDNMKGVDLLSAPKVTTKNRTRAKIEIIRELRYPSEFERPTVNSTPFEIQTGSTILGTAVYQQVYLSLPATPRQFSVKPIGVTMEVTPTTYPDQRIDLELQPEVVDFEGFINYGQPIMVRSSTESPASVETDSVVNMPVFNVRSITTKVQVLDGQTVVLGGLIREDRQHVDDKVPILGDMPLVGRFFQSKIDKTVKRNLMIFVTAKLIKSDGQAVYNQDLAVVTPKTEASGQ